MGRQQSLRGLARQESMKQQTLKNLLAEPLDGFSDSEDEREDLHLDGVPGVHLASRSRTTSIPSPRHGTRASTAPRLTAASLRERLKRESSTATEDVTEETSSGEDNRDNGPRPSTTNISLPLGDDEVEKKKKENARQAAAKDQPQFADLYD